MSRASHSPASCGAGGGDPARPGRPISPRRAVLVVVVRHVQGVPSTTAAGAGGDPVGVPDYGSIVYCQHAILERSFIDQ